MEYIIMQGIGFIGMALVVISFQKDRRSFTLKSQLLSALAFTAHFSLLSAWTGAAMNGISASRAYVFNLRGRINKNIVMYLFILLFWIAGVLTWEGYQSMLPVISMTLECFALWSGNTRHIRWLFLSARPTWIIYDFAVGSYAGLATEAFILGSVLTAIIRFDVRKKGEDDSSVMLPARRRFRLKSPHKTDTGLHDSFLRTSFSSCRWPARNPNPDIFL